jgi:hypothetical protein
MPRRQDLEEAARHAAHTTSPLRRHLTLATGWAFMALGILGLFLPVLQGVLFLIVGLIVLSSQSPWAARQLQRFLDTHPAAEALHERAERSLRRLRARWRLMLRRWRRQGRHRSL